MQQDEINTYHTFYKRSNKNCSTSADVCVSKTSHDDSKHIICAQEICCVVRGVGYVKMHYPVKICH